MSKKSMILIAVATLCLILALLGLGYLLSRTQAPLKLSHETTDLRVTNALRVSFNQEIDGSFQAELEGSPAGRWERISGPFGVREVAFVPASPLPAGKNFTMSLRHLRRAYSHSLIAETEVISFHTEQAPDIASIAPADGSSDQAVSSVVTIRLTSPNHGLRKLILVMTPQVETTALPASDDQTFSWKFQVPLTQGASYQIVVQDQNITDPAARQLATSHFTTVAEPKVTGTARAYFQPDEKLAISFDQPMRPLETHFQFDIGGIGAWTNPKTFEYTPSGIQPGTTYGYSVLKGATSVAGGQTQADHAFQVSTPGRVVVTSRSPTGSNVSRATPIRFSFDQAVDHNSAQGHFSLQPGAAGAFSWSAGTMTFTPSGLEYQTSYTASLSAGITPIFGLPSNQIFSLSFDTEPQVIKLSVPLYRQSLPLSCEEAALSMALAYRGISASEMDILTHVGYNPRPRDTATNSWDNPYDMFVGDVNGTQNSTGYGVYGPPIAAAAHAYGRGAAAYSGVTANFIAGQVLSGNPVIVWGSSRTPIMESWNTTSGMVSAWKYEHTRVVLGVVGRADAPLGFYLNDPGTGTAIYWSTAQLLANMNSLGNLTNQAVVVL